MMFSESDRRFAFDFNDLDEAHLLEPLKSPRLWSDRVREPPRSIDCLFNFQEVSFAANAQIPGPLMIARTTVMLRTHV